MSSKHITYGVLVIIVGVLILVSLPYVEHDLSVGLGGLNKKVSTREISLNPLQTISMKFNLTKGDVVSINIKLSNGNARVLLNLKIPLEIISSRQIMFQTAMNIGLKLLR